MDGYPRLDPFERSFITHPLSCHCRRPIAWIDPLRLALVQIGYCHEHRPRGALVPVAIYGREYEGWIRYPLTLADYLMLKRLGVFDEPRDA